MSDMNEMFRKECEESEIDYKEFPYDFPENSSIHYPTIIDAMMWILKKRQDRVLMEA